MNKNKAFILLLFNLILFCRASSVLAQGNYDLRLTLGSVDCATNTVCYDVQLRSADGTTWGLAGQNYRLYYDASLASWQSGVSTLPTANYQGFTLIQDIQNVDASATMGSLAFEETISFLNYTMDLSTVSTGGITLPADGSWVTTSQLCFLAADSLIYDPTVCLEVVWARDNVTDEYATSFVEVSEWIEPNNTQMAIGQVYDGLDASDGNESCLEGMCGYDYGDLPDLASGTTGINDYETYDSTGGPKHLIIDGLYLGDTVDIDNDGVPNTHALGDDTDNIDDEDGLTIFSSLDIFPGGTIKIPLHYVNTTGATAYIEAWIDWNGDGDFLDANEMVFDVSDPSAGLYDYIETMVPLDSNLNEQLGFRIRISNEDNMTPLGIVSSGEVEDYLIQVNCKPFICLPKGVSISRKN